MRNFRFRKIIVHCTLYIAHCTLVYRVPPVAALLVSSETGGTVLLWDGTFSETCGGVLVTVL